ncbi:NAD(P)-dependent oxidoreductase [Exiguobacterium sp. MMG028]|uniref:NAD(P)-dependent oxidoreductase n=1 Tax=Exiguobacterium sp. MMG028 TaxID=3021979 RepID=UPI0022FF40E7|nr:NAD(P)-dependent oxidoreductase [Exiguobacterium sp. MMG028]MDA5560804.1 NAD(P)-dependent oxidoreductase [Exiguobacterium sp. MMG028]
MKIWVTGMHLSLDQREQLEKLGHEITMLQRESDIIECDVSEVEALVCQNVFTYRTLNEFPRLQVVQAVSAGLDRLPIEQLKERDIRVYNAGDTYAVPMAEWVVWQLLDFMKYGAAFREKQQNRHWEKERRLLELSGKTVTILGVGNVSEAIAKRLRAFDMHLIGVGHREKEVPFVDRYVLMDSLYDVLRVSDVIILALPLTDDTYHLINQDALAVMKEDSILMNVARGAVIDEEALVKSLHDGKFFGVALDVFETEPIQSDHPLYEFEWVNLTPHNSYVSDQVNNRLFQNVYKNLQQYTNYFS